jgi:hypothetical protein
VITLPCAAWVYAPWVAEQWEKDCRELGPFPMPPNSGHCTILRTLPRGETYEVEVEFTAPPATHIPFDDDGKVGDRRCYLWDDIRVPDTTGNYTWVVLDDH